MSHDVGDREYNPWEEGIRTFDMTPTFPSAPFIPKGSMSSEKRMREGVQNSRLWASRQLIRMTLWRRTDLLAFQETDPHLKNEEKDGTSRAHAGLAFWNSITITQHLAWQHFVLSLLLFCFVFPHIKNYRSVDPDFFLLVSLPSAQTAFYYPQNTPVTSLPSQMVPHRPTVQG